VDTPKELPTVLSLCTGYGGIERGLGLAGFEHRVIAHVEIEAFAIANLVAKMEAGEMVPAPIWSDLKTLPVECFRDRVHLITGGYPCQPFSAAGKRKGEDDPRHLWPHIRGIIETVRPVQCFFENVEGHINLGLREVIADLESLGYETTWGIFSAAEVGAPHQRKRVFILADSNSRSRRDDPKGFIRGQEDESKRLENSDTAERRGAGVADTSSTRSATRLSRPKRSNKERQSEVANNSSNRSGWRQIAGQWTTEPDVGRVVNGCPFRVDRLRLLGNGVVPQTAAKAWVILNTEGEDSGH